MANEYEVRFICPVCGEQSPVLGDTGETSFDNIEEAFEQRDWFDNKSEGAAIANRVRPEDEQRPRPKYHRCQNCHSVHRREEVAHVVVLPPEHAAGWEAIAWGWGE